jgi:hypothetical protein
MTVGFVNAEYSTVAHRGKALECMTSNTRVRSHHRLSLIDVCGINIDYEARLNLHGIFTPMQFLAAPLYLLNFRVFQSIGGYFWYRRLRGWEVDATEFGRKSYGQNCTLKKPTRDLEELAPLLMKLTEKMGRRLRRSGQAARGVHVACLYTDMTYWHQGRMSEQGLYTTADLYRHVQHLFNRQPERKVVVSLSVNCNGLVPAQSAQLSLFGAPVDRLRKVSDAVDKMIEQINIQLSTLELELRVAYGLQDVGDHIPVKSTLHRSASADLVVDVSPEQSPITLTARIQRYQTLQRNEHELRELVHLLELQAAQYGPMLAPAELQYDLHQQRATLDRLRAELATLEGDLEQEQHKYNTIRAADADAPQLLVHEQQIERLQSDIAHKGEQLQLHEANLRALERLQANYGPDTPLHIINERDILLKQIAWLREEVQAAELVLHQEYGLPRESLWELRDVPEY